MVRTAGKPDALLGRMESLADATRLRLLRLLERHELGVVELCEVLQLPQSTVSRHLKVLSDQGWVRSRRRGTTHLYRMILDELHDLSRQLWRIARQQTDDWATVAQDELRLIRRLREKQTSSQSFFAGAAAEWDRLRDELYGRHFTTTALLALLPPHYVVADLACGTGRVAARLAPHVKEVIGIDNSLEMLDAATARIAECPNVTLRPGELESLPIETASIDAAILLLALTYVADPVPVLVEMSRILKPGARAVIVDLLPHDDDHFRRKMEQLSMGFGPPSMKSMFGNAGFSGIEIMPLVPAPDAIGPALFLATGAKTPESREVLEPI